MSTLSAEQKRELVEAEDKQLNTFVKDSVVEAASRQGISPSALMKMRWVVTFKDDGSLKARLVVQGFTDQRLGKIPTSSPTASRRSRQIFLTLAASFGFQTHRDDVKWAFLQGDLDEQHADDNDDALAKLSQRSQFRVVTKVAVGASSVCSVVEGRVRSCQRSKKMVSSCCHRSSKHERRRISHGTLLVDTSETTTASFMFFCSVHVDDFTLACSDSPFGKHVFDSMNNLYEWETWESRVSTQCGARTTQACDKHTRTWGGFEISSTEYAKEISISTLP